MVLDLYSVRKKKKKEKNGIEPRSANHDKKMRKRRIEDGAKEKQGITNYCACATCEPRWCNNDSRHPEAVSSLSSMDSIHSAVAVTI